MEEKKFEIGQRVRINDKQYPNDCNGISGTITGIDKIDDTLWHCVHLDEIPKTRTFKGEMYIYFTSDVLEAIEDDPIKNEEQQLIELKEDRSTLKSEEYIALELVKAWGVQIGQPAKFTEFIENYKKVLKELRGVENE